jgi:hypothetical protein
MGGQHGISGTYNPPVEKFDFIVTGGDDIVPDCRGGYNADGLCEGFKLYARPDKKFFIMEFTPPEYAMIVQERCAITAGWDRWAPGLEGVYQPDEFTTGSPIVTKGPDF